MSKWLYVPPKWNEKCETMIGITNITKSIFSVWLLFPFFTTSREKERSLHWIYKCTFENPFHIFSCLYLSVNVSSSQPFKWKIYWYTMLPYTLWFGIFRCWLCILYVASEEFHYSPPLLTQIGTFISMALKDGPFKILLKSQEWLLSLLFYFIIVIIK